MYIVCCGDIFDGQGERISTAVLDVALLLGIITIFIGGIRHDRK